MSDVFPPAVTFTVVFALARPDDADARTVGMSAPVSLPEPLNNEHQIGTFDSGEPVLDEWLGRRARVNQASDASRTYVVCEGKVVVGYYALLPALSLKQRLQGGTEGTCRIPFPLSCWPVCL